MNDLYGRLVCRLQEALAGGQNSPVIPVKVDLIGDKPQSSAPASAETSNPFQPRSTETPTASALASPAPASLAKESPAAQPDWQFNQSVLLRKSPRASSLIVWTVVGGTAALFTWALLAPMSETIAVQGRLVPGSRVKTIQAPNSGIVEAVLVKEGQNVSQGQLLLRFDLRQARSQLAANEAIRTRLQNENQIYAATLGDQTASGLTANQRLQLQSQASELSSRREAARQELMKSMTRLQGLRASLATASDIARRYDALSITGAVSNVQVLEMRNKEQELRTQASETEREIDRLRSTLENTTATSSVDLRTKIETNLRQISDLDRQIREARLLIQNGQLLAPTSGTVFDLTTPVGKVVEATTPLLKVVPHDALEAKVFVPNKAIGFLTPGQKAEISLDTFPSSDYGRIPAKVLRLGTDALTPEERKETLGSDASGLYYPAVLSLSRQGLQAKTGTLPLKAGMSLTADIHLRNRPVISLLTSFFEDKRRSLERLR